jgi:hypothetical protein
MKPTPTERRALDLAETLTPLDLETASALAAAPDLTTFPRRLDRLWAQGVRVSPARAQPETVERVIPPSPVGFGGQAEPCFDDPFPDYDTEPVMLYANA